MSVNFSNIAKFSTKLNNPNSPLPLSTALIEVPSDIAKGCVGYKRGGIIEGAEKLRKELLSAVVWLCGIPIFRALGNKFCENALGIPTNIAYSNSKEGNAAIENSIEFLTTGVKKGRFLDTSDLEEKYFRNGVSIFKGQDTQELIKKVKTSKKVISIAAVALNCLMMGVVMPLINQKITSSKLKKMSPKTQKKEPQKYQDSLIKTTSFDDFRQKTENKEKSQISFKGNTLSAGADVFVDLVENSSRFRLIAPDVPMIAGRVATSRNKFEGLEYIITDGLGMYFYNFCAGHVQSILQNKTATENIDAPLAEAIASLGEDKIKEALLKLDQNEDVYKNIKKELKEDNSVIKNIINSFKAKIKGAQPPEEKLPQAYFILENLFDKQTSDELYKQATNGGWGKMNAYVKNQQINSIDDSIVKFLKRVKSQAAELDEKGNITSLNMQKLNSFVKTNNANKVIFQIMGIIVSIIGLGIFAPKLSYFVTQKLTGKNEFIALSHLENDKKANKK